MERRCGIRIRIGTRKSVMALAQTEEIARRLTSAAPELDVETSSRNHGRFRPDRQAVAARRQGAAHSSPKSKAVFRANCQVAMHRSRTCRAMKTRRAS